MNLFHPTAPRPSAFWPFTAIAGWRARRRTLSDRPPPPRSVRELLDALVAYDPAAGIEPFLDRYEFNPEAALDGVVRAFAYIGQAPAQPDTVPAAAPGPGSNQREQLRDALQSDAFRHHLILNLCQAYPEKRRLWFVHIPKCAGTDLIGHLSTRYPHLSRIDEGLQQTHPDTLAILKPLAARLAGQPELAVTGHIPLAWLIDRQLVRPTDSVFALVRDPVELLISHANFMASTLLDPVTMQNPDIRQWMLGLGVTPPPPEPDAGDARRLALAFLHHPGLLPANPLCTYLGRTTAASARELCAAAAAAGTDVELSTVSRYDRWLQQRWGIHGRTQRNVSRKLLTRETLDPASLDHLHAQTVEDRVFHALIEQRLSVTGRASLRGAELA